jgi:hypothetical protein
MCVKRERGRERREWGRKEEWGRKGASFVRFSPLLLFFDQHPQVEAYR